MSHQLWIFVNILFRDKELLKSLKVPYFGTQKSVLILTRNVSNNVDSIFAKIGPAISLRLKSCQLTKKGLGCSEFEC